jgi:hypothetical protein
MPVDESEIARYSERKLGSHTKTGKTCEKHRAAATQLQLRDATWRRLRELSLRSFRSPAENAAGRHTK